jgi:hypothetical protein
LISCLPRREAYDDARSLATIALGSSWKTYYSRGKQKNSNSENAGKYFSAFTD